MTPRSAAALPPVLLTDATWLGTLAAARDLGSRGVPVVLATDRLAAPARWSRHVGRTVRCPSTADAERFGAWLEAFARREPGHVYYPTSDDAAWIASTRRDALEPGLSLYSPPVETLAALLDKWQLRERAVAAGLSAPDTWLAQDEEAVRRLAGELPFPVIVKPRIHVLARGWAKAQVARDPAGLLPAWRAMRDGNLLAGEVLARLPGADLPVIQALRPGAERIYTVDGFVDAAGGPVVALACVKTLQSPRGSGPGVVFEGAPLAPAVTAGLGRLFRGCGYHGVFDAEFVQEGERLLLIDVNPRFYNHMAFEIDRGLPLAWWAYQAARGEGEGLRRSMEAPLPPADGRVYVHRLRTRLLLAAQRLSGGMTGEEVDGWRAWIRSKGGGVTDPAAAPGDRLPALAEAALEAQRALSHPREFLRSHLRRASPPDDPSRPGA